MTDIDKIKSEAVKSMVSEELAGHTPGAMRAAKDIYDAHVYGTGLDKRNLAETIDRETGLPELLGVLKCLEWHPMDGTSLRCPYCMNPKSWGHRHDCKVAAAIKKAETPT